MMPLEWSNETVLKFLELYANEEAIWDPSHKDHKLKHKIHDAWKRISMNFYNTNIKELKSKKKSLMTTFRSLLKKKKASIRSGAGEDEVFQPVWFAYDTMENFLGSVYDVQDTINTEDEPQSDENTAVPSPSQNQHNKEALVFWSSCNEDSLETTDTKQLSKINTSGKKRKFKSPQDIEIEQSQNNISQSFDILNRVLRNNILNDEDDCDLYAKLLAIKLRRYPEIMRLEIMYKIDGFLLENPYPTEET